MRERVDSAGFSAARAAWRNSGNSGNDPAAPFSVAVLPSHMDAIPELPTLDPGVQLLDADRTDAVGPLHALVLDQVLADCGTALWVDSRGHAQTAPLVRLAPDDGLGTGERVLDRVQVARAFTAYQHLALVERLRERVDSDTSLVVLPAIDAHYRADDVGRERGQRFLLRALATVATLAREHDLPVLVTRSRADAFTAPVSRAADRELTCERTEFGPRFAGTDFETLVYPHGDGTVQTTLAFWQRVLAARHADGVRSNADEPSSRADEPATSSTTPPVPTAGEVTVDGAH